MNNQLPYGYMQQPVFPGVNDINNSLDMQLHNIEKRLNTLENKLKNIESKLNISNTSNMDYNPYQSSMHMM